jgi:prophage regulatory protein
VSETRQVAPNQHARRHAPALAARAETDASVVARQAERIIREPECKERTGLSRATRWRLERTGKFPARVQLSPGCCGWRESEICARIAAR